jgi:23S rRNA (cytosine1962-C5)-methyltransferase
MDTRNLRRWVLNNLAGKSVLNTFAYTGSLGVAASAAGAKRVVHLDHSKKYLNLARQSYILNGLPIDPENYLVGDFWEQIARLKRRAVVRLYRCRSAILRHL